MPHFVGINLYAKIYQNNPEDLKCVAIDHGRPNSQIDHMALFESQSFGRSLLWVVQYHVLIVTDNASAEAIPSKYLTFVD